MIELILIGSVLFLIFGKKNKMNSKPTSWTVEGWENKVGYARVLHWSSEIKRWRNGLEIKLPVAWCLAILAQESFGKPTATGSAGEIGLMQLTYIAFKETGVPYSYDSLTDPIRNIETGMKYIKWIEGYLEKYEWSRDFFVHGTVVSYNIGAPTLVKGTNQKALDAGQNYITGVNKHREELIKRWT